MFKLLGMILAANVVVYLLFAYDRSSDQVQRDAQEISLRQANESIGMPNIRNFRERSMLKQIFEERDRVVSTTTYILDLSGHAHKLCDSVGYGLPYSTQFTNPEQNPNGNVVLALAEPNGLFSPITSEGTWISCLNPVSKETQVVYVEPRVIVSPFPLSVN